jgi:non-specific serine/threonine protein kinase
LQERSAREQAYLWALERLAEHALAVEDLRAAERHLRQAAVMDPFRESVQRSLIEVLAVSGNYTAAIEIYHELRERLHREMNGAPDVETTARFHQLRAEARAKVTTGRGSGPPRRARRDGVRAFAHNLPAPVSRFIGRKEAMAAVTQLLSTARLLTLTGSGGCGKTRLALQVAADRVEAYADGVWLVELAALSDPGLVPQAVASALGVREEPGRPLLAALTDSLRFRSLLLVLGNCEHLLLACAQLAESLLRACPNLRILATSREGLGMAGEQTYRVPSLSLPDIRNLPPLEQLHEFEAVQLFADRARLSQPGFVVTPANASAVAQVCERLDGIPLAIELAAARVKALPVEKLNQRLDDMFRLLTAGSRTAPPRHQTLRALIDWSHNLLSEPERALLRRLSVFAGGWTLEAAEAVCAGQETEERQVLNLLTRLVETSLVLYEEREDGGRYRLLETVRQYGREHLEEAAEAVAVRGRHRDWFLELAEQGEPELVGAHQAQWLDRLEREHDNLRAALAWSEAEGPVEAGLRLGGALREFWYARGYWTEGREYLEGLLALPGAKARTVGRAKALAALGFLVQEQGEREKARTLFEESLEICRERGDRLDAAYSLGMLGNLARGRGEYEAARALLEESRAIHREECYKRGIAWSLHLLGGLAQTQGEYDAARVLYEESLVIHREADVRGGIAWSLGALGNVARIQGEYGTARALLEECLLICQELDYNQGILWSLIRLGELTRDLEQYGAARAFFQESLLIARELGDANGIAASAMSLEALGGLAPNGPRES